MAIFISDNLHIVGKFTALRDSAVNLLQGKWYADSTQEGGYASINENYYPEGYRVYDQETKKYYRLVVKTESTFDVNHWKVDEGDFTKEEADALYAKIATTYTKTEVDDLVNSIHKFDVVVVDTLPVASAGTMYKIYLIPKTGGKTQNIKEEYITLKGGTEESPTYTWEKIGDTAIDLSGYVQKTTEIAGVEIGDGISKEDLIDALSGIESGDVATIVSATEIAETKGQEAVKYQQVIVTGNSGVITGIVKQSGSAGSMNISVTKSPIKNEHIDENANIAQSKISGLVTALARKQATLTAGNGITIDSSNNIIADVSISSESDL